VKIAGGRVERAGQEPGGSGSPRSNMGATRKPRVQGEATHDATATPRTRTDAFVVLTGQTRGNADAWFKDQPAKRRKRGRYVRPVRESAQLDRGTRRVSRPRGRGHARRRPRRSWEEGFAGGRRRRGDAPVRTRPRPAIADAAPDSRPRRGGSDQRTGRWRIERPPPASCTSRTIIGREAQRREVEAAGPDAASSGAPTTASSA